GGDAAEMAEKVQRRPLAGQQTARRPLDSGDHVSWCDHAAVRPLHGEPDGRIDQLKGTARDVEPGHDAWLARAQQQGRLPVGWDDRVRRDVAGAAQIFQQGGANQRLVHEGQKRGKRHGCALPTDRDPVSMMSLAASSASASEMDDGTAEGRVLGKSLRKCPPRLSSRRRAETAIINPTKAGSEAALLPLAIG